jgi:hypothetical protein
MDTTGTPSDLSNIRIPTNDRKKVTKKDIYTRYSFKTKFSSDEEEENYAKTVQKKCTKCGKTKYLNEFNGNTSSDAHFNKDGYLLRRPECKDCTKEATAGKNLAKKFAKEEGIPYKAPPGTKCLLCDKEGTRNNPIVFDHCHIRKKFRGYLCNSCNRSLGVLGDSVEGLLKSLNYLNVSENKTIIQTSDTKKLVIIPE